PVTFDDAVHLGQAEARAEASFGSKEGLERPFADFGRHAHAGVAHLESDLGIGDDGPKTERASANHRVEGVVDEVKQCFAKFASDADDVRVGGDVTLEMDVATTRPLGPQRPRHRDDLVANY